MAEHPFVRDDRETRQFIQRNEGVIRRACFNAGLRRSEVDVVLDNLALKYAQGRLVFDETRGTKESTYVYTCAYNEAKSLIRASIRFVELDDETWENIPDERGDRDEFTREDVRFLREEALKRLSRKYDKREMELFVRWAFCGEHRNALAEEYSMAPSYLSVLCSRMKEKYEGHVEDVLREDEEGYYRRETDDIGYLKRYLKNV